MGKKAPTRAKTAKPGKAKPAVKPSPKAASKPAAKAPAKSAAKPTAKPAPKPVASKGKPTAVVASKPTKAGVAKAAAGKAPAVKPPAKPDAKTTVVKPGAKPDAKGAPKVAAGKPAPAAKPAAPTKGSAKDAAKDAAKEPVKGGKPGGKAGAPAKGAEKPADKTADKGADKPGEAVTIGPDGKPVRKGITIVQNKSRRTGPKPVKIQIPKGEPLLGPGSPFRKPLIASGPGAVRKTLEIDPEALAKLKSPFNKKELQRFRDILLKKRADLVGDVSDLESEALLGRSGSLSALPQHIAEQGSETYEQSLSLNLAAEDRRLIREIDGALQRIDKGTFGICEMTGKTITRERLEELPWTRYSIEAAREFERRSMGR